MSKIPVDYICGDNNREKYKCPLCSYLLQDAVQTSCGHWFCQDCAESFFKTSAGAPRCPKLDCGAQLLLKEEVLPLYFPDENTRTYIDNLSVRCRHDDCAWTGLSKEWSQHVKQLCQHNHMDRPLVTCEEVDNYKPAPSDLSFIQNKCPSLPDDAQLVYNDLRTLEKQCPHCSEIFTNLIEVEDHKEKCPEALVTCPFVDFGCEVTEQMTRADCDKHLEVTVDNHSTLLQVAFQSIPAGTVGDDIKYLLMQIAQKDSQIQYLEYKLQHVEALAKRIVTEYEDRDFRLSLMENSSYDGTMIWKIPQFTQRMDDARTGKYTSIFSLPFYSGRYGYKMCLRLYILGDGIGKGSHMSLFFVLMKGGFDSILQWPFNYKVTFKLFNQCGGRDVVDVFEPDPLSSSFQQPKTDMNIASGCPRFVSLNELMQSGFIMDDTIFIKVVVDITTTDNCA